MMTEMPQTPEKTPAETAAETTSSSPLWRPLTDIVETKDGIGLMIELPGVSPGDVDVSLEKRVLTIRARSSTVAPDKLRPVHVEYEPGDYERAFTLSGDYDPNRIEAEMKNGVLTLTLPRAAALEAQKIKVKAG